MRSVFVGLIKEVKFIEKMIGLRGELSNEGREQVSAVLLVGVPKIEVKVSHGGQSTVV